MLPSIIYQRITEGSVFVHKIIVSHVRLVSSRVPKDIMFIFYLGVIRLRKCRILEMSQIDAGACNIHCHRKLHFQALCSFSSYINLEILS